MLPVTARGSKEWPVLHQDLFCRTCGASRKIIAYLMVRGISAYFRNFM
jgi:hypothetical protein